ncbi:MAG: hypothetical protein HW421_2689 [Ignavibacteria bacterium]|nr:hypothetical protein [Ignavibacteria bacterium]
MKKLYLITALMLLSNVLSAQQAVRNPIGVQLPDAGIQITQPPELNLNYSKILPAINQKSGDQILESQDSLNQYFKRSTSFASYGVNLTINGQTYTFPLTGYNPLYYYLGQKFNVDGSYKVSELLFACLQKAFIGNNVDSIRGFIYEAPNVNGLPTTPLANGFIMFDEIDTSSSTVIFSSIKFDNPPTVSTRFVALIFTFNGTNEYDYVALYSNNQGDGNSENMACLIYYNNGWYSNNFSTYWNARGLRMQDNNPPNFDIMIVPIVENTSGVDQPISINGLTLKNICPNPVINETVLTLEISKPCNLTVDLVDMNGKIVYSLTRENCMPGEMTIQLDLAGIPSGSYHYLLNSGYSKFGGKLNIVK